MRPGVWLLVMVFRVEVNTYAYIVSHMGYDLIRNARE
jgi:hypothetical protein